jgi:hypothetical protein
MEISVFRPGLTSAFPQLIFGAALCWALEQAPAVLGQELQSQQAKLDTSPTKGAAFATPPSYLKTLRASSQEEIESAKHSRFLVNQSFGAEQIKPIENLEHSRAKQPALPSEFFGQPNGLVPTGADPVQASGIPARRTAHTNFALNNLALRDAPLQGAAQRGRTVDLEKLYGHSQFEVNDPRLKMLELQQISKSRFEPPGTFPIEAY